MRRQLRFFLLVLSLVLGLTSRTSAGKSQTNENQDPTFTTIDFPGSTATVGRDVTADGHTYVGEYDDITGHHGFLLKSGALTSIDGPGSVSTDAHGINSRGDIVGVFRTGDGQSHGYLMNRDGLSVFDVENSTGTSFMGINDHGDIVGGWCDGTITPCPAGGEGNRGFLLSDGQFTTIDFPRATLTQAWKINAQRDVVGVYRDTAGHFHGFLWHVGEFESIDVPGSVGTLALGINNRGEIVGSYCTTMPCGIPLVNNHGFVLRQGEFTSFDFPDTDKTRALAINARGDIVGAYQDFNNKNHAFLIKRKGDDAEDDDKD